MADDDRPSATVHEFPGITKLDISSEKVVRATPFDDLEFVLVLGVRKSDPSQLYAACSTGDGKAINHLIDLFKLRLLSGHYDT